jgi:hypothetical protein
VFFLCSIGVRIPLKLLESIPLGDEDESAATTRTGNGAVHLIPLLKQHAWLRADVECNLKGSCVK